MCDANNLFLTIDALRTYMFSKLAIGCKVLWRSIKVVESTWNTISYCWIYLEILGLVRIQIET
jgi:hypothetical protein